jgi:hypothetical protein
METESSEHKGKSKKKTSSEVKSSGSRTSTRSTTSAIGQRIRQVSLVHPPNQNPIGFSLSVIAAICCATTAIGVGLCLIVGLFFFVQLIPVAAIVVGGIYWDRERYCPAENLSLLLVIGGICQILQVILAEMVTVRTTRKKISAFELFSEETTTTTTEGNDFKAGKKKSESKIIIPTSNEEQTINNEQTFIESTQSAHHSRPRFVPREEPETETTVEEIVEVVVVEEDEERPDTFGFICEILNLILTIANICWLITASVLVYRLKPSNPRNCDETLYEFAFWYVTSFYIVIGIVLVCVILVMLSGPILGLILKRWERNHNVNSDSHIVRN